MDHASSDEEGEASRLGRKDHWDETYAQELDNFEEHGDEGEIWFGEDVMAMMVGWTADLLQREHPTNSKELAILDVGTGNGVLPLELASLGFTNVAGSDYSQAAIQLARAVAERRGMQSVKWIVDDLLHCSIYVRFNVITDKGTFDAVGLSQDAAVNRKLYRSAVGALLMPGGLLVITSCNTTRDELVKEFCDSRASHCESSSSETVFAAPDFEGGCNSEAGRKEDSKVSADGGVFVYLDHVRTYPVFRFGGIEGSRVCTVAFRRT